MFENCRRMPVTLWSWDKKKLEKYCLTKTDVIGFAHKKALIRFFYKENPDELDIDQICQRLSELEWLSKLGVLSSGQFNLKFQ